MSKPPWVLAALGLAVVASARADDGRPWYVHYDKAQRLLVAGDAAGAEAELRAALSRRPEEGCRLRTYGIRYVDYVPRYYLSVAEQAQGRADEARIDMQAGLDAGVVGSCPGTRAQEADLRERLRALSPLPAAMATAAPPAAPSLAALRELAIASGASATDPTFVAAERDAAAAGEGDASADARARAGYEAAASSARLQAAIAAGARRDASEAIAGAELAIADAGAADPGATSVVDARAALDDAKRLLGASGAPTAAADAARSRAERAESLARAVTPAASAPAGVAAPSQARTASSSPRGAAAGGLVTLSWSAALADVPAVLELRPAGSVP